MTIVFESVIFFAIFVLAIYGIAVFKRMEETDSRLKESIKALGEAVDELINQNNKSIFHAEDTRNNLYGIKNELKHLNRLIVMHHTIDEWDRDMWKREMPE